MFDAIEQLEGERKLRLVLVNATDIRDLEKLPTYYVSPSPSPLVVLSNVTQLQNNAISEKSRSPVFKVSPPIYTQNGKLTRTFVSELRSNGQYFGPVTV